MAKYKLSASAWLGREVSRARGVLVVHMERDREYTVEEVLAMLSEYGLHYSNPQYAEIGQQLIAAGVIEAV